MLFNERACGLDAVHETLEKSEKFGWSWCKEKFEPFNHTAIILYFDNYPSFTINFRPADGYKKHEALVDECEGLIIIEYVNETLSVDYQDPLQQFVLNNEEEREKAKSVIDKILSHNPGKYNLIKNNCRHHVVGVIDLMTYHSGAGIQDVINGDILRAVMASAALVLFTGTVVGLVAGDSVDGTLTNASDDDENEKREAA